MTGDLDHVLLTRFSAVQAAGSPPARAEWLFYRLGFFYDACYPSVTRQRDAAPFSWLVLFDDRCPDDFREQVETLAHGAFTPIWSHREFQRDSFAEPVAAATGPDHASHLVTTRLDSDDALAVDFMAAVQGQFARQDRLFVNFTRGVQIDRTGAVYRSDTLSSPFLSLIERRQQDRLPDTVYVAKHARARAHGPIREVRAPVMWAQVVHDLNASNIVTGTRVSPRAIEGRFDVDLTYDHKAAGVPLLWARSQQVGRLSRLWAAHPGELTKFAEARVWRLRGTHERYQDDGRTATDRVQAWEQRVRQERQAVIFRAKHETRLAKWRLQRRLNEAMPHTPHLVAGDLDSVLLADKVVVIAEYSPVSRTVRPGALDAAGAWARAGCPALVVAARDAWSPWPLRHTALPKGVALLRRPNVGYDFGSWSAVLQAFPHVATSRRVILTNDSLDGPYGPLDDLLARIEASTTNVWAATANSYPTTHMQSYLLAFGDGVLAREPLRSFFAGVRPQQSKRKVIQTYEFGLTHLLQRHGMTWEVGWPKAALGLDDNTDSILGGWPGLLRDGFPFVKRTLLETARYASARPDIHQAIRDLCDVDPLA